MSSIFHHEAGHAAVAYLLGLQVVSAVADGDDASVQTRHPAGAPRAASLVNGAITGLAGPAAEREYLAGMAWCSDEERAYAHIRHVIQLRHGLPDDAPLTPAMHKEATELLEETEAKAAKLVREHWSAVNRIAEALGRGEKLLQADIVRLMRVVPPSARKNEEQAETVPAEI